MCEQDDPALIPLLRALVNQPSPFVNGELTFLFNSTYFPLLLVGVNWGPGVASTQALTILYHFGPICPLSLFPLR